MRRICAVALVLLTLALPVFAGTFDFGASYGGAFGFMDADSTINVKASNPYSYFQSQFNFDAAWFSESNLGAGLGLSVVVPSVYWEFDKTFAPDDTVFPTAFKTYATFRYKYQFAERFALEAGAGLYVTAGSKLYNSVKYSAFEVGGELDVALRYTQLDDNGLIKIGLKADAPFYSKIDQQDGGRLTQYGGRLTQYGVALIPYVGFWIMAD